MTSIKINTVILIFLTVTMISLGGITRLTESGLSMVTWKIITGIIPPLNNAEWSKEFQRYQQFPEYQILNQDMSLSQFKTIFYFEYFHRVLGRIIGLFTILLVALTFVKKADVSKKLQSILLLILVSIQGVVGWYMVQSGLIDTPRVSHFRLLLHFSLALLFLTFLLYFAYKLFTTNLGSIHLQQISDALSKKSKQVLKYLTTLSMIFLIVQITFGALLAGLDAGLVSSSYPKMFGVLVPPNLMDFPGDSIDKIFSNPVFINFFHRHLGIATALILLLTGLYGLLTPLNKSLVLLMLSTGLIVFALAQPIIGIMTLVLQVPVKWGAIHQIVAVFLWMNLFYFFLITRKIIS